MRIRVASAAEIDERATTTFWFPRGSGEEVGILARHDGRLVAYVNRCMHRPLPLDWDDGQFYAQDRDHFVCQTHGAQYEPATGLCVLGPCAGAVLEAIPLELDGDDVYARIDD